MIGGNLRRFRADLLDFLLDTARDYGPLASSRVGPRRLFLASGPDLIEQVLVTDSKYYIKHFGARAFKPVLGNGLVTSEGELWQRQRKLIQPAFLAFDLMTARLRKVFKLLLWMPTAANLRLQRAIAELDRTVQNFIALGEVAVSGGRANSGHWWLTR